MRKSIYKFRAQTILNLTSKFKTALAASHLKLVNFKISPCGIPCANYLNLMIKFQNSPSRIARKFTLYLAAFDAQIA